MKKVVMTLSALGLLVGSVMSHADTAANNTMAANPGVNTNTNTMVNSNTMVNGNTMTTPGATTGTTAGNPQKPVSEWTCEDFLVLDETIRPHAIAYGSGLNDKDKAKDAVYDATATETIVPYVVEECTRNPKSSFMEKIKNGWDKMKTDVRNEVKR